MKDEIYTYLTYLTISVFFIFRVIYIATTEDYNLAPDEAYFWDWSRHPALSYYDMGPMVAWVIWFFTHILPLSEFSVRLGAPVLAAMTAFLAYRLTVEITLSGIMGLIVVLLLHLTPIGMAGGIIMTYYSPQIFFMSLTAFSLWRLVRDNKAWWWYLVGLSLGLGLLSHHMFVVFTAEVLLFVILSPNQRKWFAHKELYLAMLIESLVASPVFIWNMTHNFVMFRHATGLMAKTHSFIDTLLNYIGGQAAVQTPLLFLAVIYGMAVSGYHGIRFKDDKHLFLFCLSAPIMLFIALLSIGGRTEANWPISGYITGTISAVYILSEKYKNGSSLIRSLVAISLASTIALCMFITAIAHYPYLLDKLGINLTPDKDPASRLYGWKELGKEVSSVLSTLPHGSFVAAIEYGLTAELAFYTKDRPEIFEIPAQRRHSQYDFWNNFKAVQGKDAVFVDTGHIGKEIEALFNRVEPAGHIRINSKNGIRREFYLYKCYGYKGTAAELAAF
ncbi:MAG: glycosyltransferase family 39 protein [Deltaproteobacteria bacterium]|nr:glycosyltransferase family 39 protein [Deltaproteobacteria bacterium]